MTWLRRALPRRGRRGDAEPPGDGPPMLVPAQWAGSVEHFYHFLLGYLHPIAMHVEETGIRTFTLRDCGPMNPWLRLAGGADDVEIVPPGMMLHRLVRGLQPAVILPALDDPATLDPALLARFRALILAAAGVPADAGDAGDGCVVISRGPSDAFYLDGRAEIEGAGAVRRSIPNLGDVHAALRARAASTLIVPEHLDPVRQVAGIARARILVGQHGAGLSHMIWMAPGSLVVEILPPLPADQVVVFDSLARALGHRHVVVEQAALHAEVPVDAVVAAALG